MIRKFESEIWSWEAREIPERLDDSVFGKWMPKFKLTVPNTEGSGWEGREKCFKYVKVPLNLVSREMKTNDDILIGVVCASEGLIGSAAHLILR